ncbi:hypothetical protein [Apilactobacillus micheneri]|uniref:hypothetical protein n=1 Tax=Apilactobacillus micheneri TaxID=1899430 RepID=UPI000D0482A8|nr:hypothetical protein [Apilactobacillus micheneri]TPR37972.1 hypothetical protein DY116_01765 [Apilactobacillus micheneri]
MQSSLKKSLYLGLAALSFASVASVTANSSNANAAKKHAAAKKVTYKTTNKNLDQSVTFKSTGKNAVYNKAVGKRSVVASLSDMKSKANSNSTKDLFMAYQEGVTSKGVHYYKVVSFDKKVRGFVYNKGVAKTNTTVAANKPANATGYLTNTNRFFNKAYGSQFKTSLKNDYKGMNIAADQFTVSDAVKVNNDQTYYYVTDKNNQLINGWVNSVYFSNTITDAAKNATNSANAIHVKFVDRANYGSVLMEKDMNPDNLSSTGTYSANDVNNSVNKALVGTGFDNPSSVSDSVAKGNTITVTVDKGATQYLTPANFKSAAYSNAGTINQKQENSDEVNGKLSSLQLSSDQWKALFQGNANQTFNFNNFEASLLAPGKPWNQFTIGTKTYTYNANYTRNSNDNKVNTGNNNYRDKTYDEIAGKPGAFTIYYDVKDSSNTTTNNGDVNNTVYLAKSAISAYNNENNPANKLSAAEQASGNTNDAAGLQKLLESSGLTDSTDKGYDALHSEAQSQAGKDVTNANLSKINSAAKSANDKLAAIDGDATNNTSNKAKAIAEVKKDLKAQGFKQSDLSTIQSLVANASNDSVAGKGVANYNNFKTIVADSNLNLND